MNLQDKGVIAIARSLKDTDTPYLRFLNVGANCITPKAAPALAECLAVKKLLTGFYARDNGLENYGSIAICKAILEGHEQLKELDLSANAMTITGAKAAAEAVANKPDFSWLSIYGNFINEKGIETIKDVLRKDTSGKSESVLGRMLDSDKMMLNVVEYMDGYKREEEGFTDSESEGLTDSDTEVEEKLWHEDL